MPPGLRVRNLSSQPVRLKTCLSLGFPEERLPCSRNSLNVAKNGQTNLVPISAGFQCLIWSLLTAGLGFSLRWKICQETAMEVVDFAVDFCGGFFGCKMQKKNPPKKSAGKSANRKQKIRRHTTPLKSASQAQKSAAKPTNKSAWQTSKYTPGLQSMESWILGHFLAAFWAWSRLPC